MIIYFKGKEWDLDKKEQFNDRDYSKILINMMTMDLQKEYNNFFKNLKYEDFSMKQYKTLI